MLEGLVPYNPRLAWIAGCLDEDRTILTLLLEILGWTVSDAPQDWAGPNEKPAIFFFGIGHLQFVEDFHDHLAGVVHVLVANQSTDKSLIKKYYNQFHLLLSPIEPTHIEVILQTLKL